MKTIAYLVLISSVVFLCSCGPSGKVTSTRINVEFPFEPGFPGYIFDLSSAGYTANLMCALPEKGQEGTGEVFDLDGEDGAKPLGVCDTRSMTLNFGISGELTLTAILGGFPFLHNVTQKPSRIVDISNPQTCPDCKQAEYDFKGGFPK